MLIVLVLAIVVGIVLLVTFLQRSRQAPPPVPARQESQTDQPGAQSGPAASVPREPVPVQPMPVPSVSLQTAGGRVDCPSCGRLLTADSPGGLCAECLIREALDSAVSGANEGLAIDPRLAGTTPGSQSFQAPEPEELAPLFPQIEIHELVGQGGMGAVYKARQPRLDRLVALKLIRPESADDPAFAERFTREARTLARLSHPNIVSIHDFGEVQTGDGQSLFYFVMEYIDGANLRQLLLAEQLEPQQAVAIVPQICEALQYAHDEGVVHRDIKPENILLDTRGRVKIADFGLARLISATPADYTLTGTHQVMGTPRYMAPEQMEGSRSVDHRADIYSLGVVFYEMLTGELPLGRFDLPSHKAAVDARLDEVVLRTLEKQPERRYQRASELRADLGSIASGSSVPALPASGSVRGPVPAAVPPAGPSTILDREVSAMWHWVAGEEATAHERRLPLLVMCLLSAVGLLMVLLPWVRVSIAAEPPIEETFYGSDKWPGIAATVCFGAMFLLLIAVPARSRLTIRWTVAMTVLSGLAILHTFLFGQEVDSTRYDTPGVESAFVTTGNPESLSLCFFQDGPPALTQLPHEKTFLVGFYGALACSVTLMLLSAVGIRHAISLKPERARQSASWQPRFSRKAICGALWAPMILFAMAFFVTTDVRVEPPRNGNPPSLNTDWWIAVPAAILGVLGALSPFGTTILGVMALSEIQAAQGRVRGLVLAFFDALLYPLLVLDLLIVGGGSFVLSRGGGDSVPIAVGMLILLPLALLIDAVVIWWLWRRVTRNVPPVLPARPVPLSDPGAPAVVERQDSAAVTATPVRRTRLWRTLTFAISLGVMGLCFVPWHRVDGEGEFDGTTVSIGDVSFGDWEFGIVATQPPLRPWHSSLAFRDDHRFGGGTPDWFLEIPNWLLFAVGMSLCGLSFAGRSSEREWGPLIATGFCAAVGALHAGMVTCALMDGLDQIASVPLLMFGALTIVLAVLAATVFGRVVVFVFRLLDGLDIGRQLDLAGVGLMLIGGAATVVSGGMFLLLVGSAAGVVPRRTFYPPPPSEMPIIMACCAAMCVAGVVVFRGSRAVLGRTSLKSAVVASLLGQPIGLWALWVLWKPSAREKFSSR